MSCGSKLNRDVVLQSFCHSFIFRFPGPALGSAMDPGKRSLPSFPRLRYPITIPGARPECYVWLLLRQKNKSLCFNGEDATPAELPRKDPEHQASCRLAVRNGVPCF